MSDAMRDRWDDSDDERQVFQTKDLPGLLTFTITLSEFDFNHAAVESNAVHVVSCVLCVADGLELVIKSKLRSIVHWIHERDQVKHSDSRSGQGI